jgi:hypothetical protein
MAAQPLLAVRGVGAEIPVAAVRLDRFIHERVRGPATGTRETSEAFDLKAVVFELQ